MLLADKLLELPLISGESIGQISEILLIRGLERRQYILRQQSSRIYT